MIDAEYNLDWLKQVEEDFGDTYPDYCAALEESEQELQGLFTVNYNEYAEKIEFEQLCSITFKSAKMMIDSMSLRKRINILRCVSKRLDSLYEGTTKYNDQGFGKSLPPEQFYKIMGKIKHMETLTAWLYGVE